MIGLIFGETSFPKEILKKIKKKKKKYLIIDLTKNRIFKRDKNCFTVSIGQFGKIINILKENNCKKVIFAGSVKKPNFSKLRLDLKGINLIGLRRKKYDNKKIIELDLAYKKIFSSNNLQENLSKINGEFKANELVQEVTKFIEKDKKRPICTPLSE